MSLFDALILGIVQGITEFLPISSDGHLEITKAILNNKNLDNGFLYTVVLHFATTLSIIVVFYKDILQLIKSLFSFKWNDDTKLIVKIAIATIPVAIVGLFFKDYVESLFNVNLVLVAFMLILTGIFLIMPYFIKQNNKDINYRSAFVIGIAQAFAVLPGLSRSGTTIPTAMMLGVNRDKAARFSFLMVIVPILGDITLELLKGDLKNTNIMSINVFVGFIFAFITGIFACKLLLNFVKRNKLIYFAIYCFVVGTSILLFSFLK